MKTKYFELLDHGSASCKQQYLKHISCLINHEIQPKESFKEHFERLIEKYKDDQESSKAIKEFIDLQDEQIMPLIIWDAYDLGDPEETGKQWHNFNLGVL